MKVYNDVESLNRDIEISNLERQIAWEEIKSVKEEYKESLKPLAWVQFGIKFASKFGAMILIKKLIK